ncbi:hypothetical protein [Bradyrhizobium nanningense]|uniref:hypothetical protein n=1 Tax=Bradyrhizobium nanningense TaxID=1325118 RepID=UPI001FE01CD4|nr:hypothetical protein [Bradyrhizobium nanningense]
METRAIGRSPRLPIVVANSSSSASASQAVDRQKKPAEMDVERGTMELSDRAAASDLRPLLQRTSRRSLTGFLVLLLLLAGSCASGAWLWANFEQFAETPEVQDVTSTMNPPSEDRALMSELKWAQQKADDEIVELNRRVDALHADLKGILDQISALTSRIDSLQSSTSLPSAAPVLPLPPARAVSGSARKRFGRSKPEGPVSVGGAPVTGPKKASPEL